MASDKAQVRSKAQRYPDFTAEIAEIEAGGVTVELVRKIIEKHRPCAAYNQKLYDRYRGEVPIFERTPRFKGEEQALNNRINNDFFGEIIDLKAGYFAGKPIGYSYAMTEESAEETGPGTVPNAGAVDDAGKALTDFVMRNNMYDVDSECTKMAACCGYAARLFYHDEEGHERVMWLEPFEVAILSKTDITRPFCGVRYYSTADSEGKETWHAEYYDHSDRVLTYSGSDITTLEPGEELLNLYGRCPLQGIPNNAEMQGDAEKVLSLIDAYDRALSDANNELESFANAYMLFENINISDEDMKRGRKAGAFRYFNGGTAAPGKISFLTKDINDAFQENQLERLEHNIYRFSRTPNLTDENFSQNASGVALKFKLTGLETKCGMFQAKMQSAGMYMFELLAASWGRKGQAVDPLQCVMDFHRNFPLDLVTEAQAVGALVDAGVPKRLAFGQLSFVEDVEYVMQLIQQELAEEQGGYDGGGGGGAGWADEPEAPDAPGP